MNPTLESAARDLVRAIYQDPDIPEPGAPLLVIPENQRERQSYRNGYYSARDLPEFKQLLDLLKKTGAWT